MTVPSAVSKSGPYTGNGVTVSFAYQFRILDASHIQVVRTEGGVDTVLTTGFTVTGVGNANGNVVFAVAPTAAQKITLIRNVPFVQQTDLENQGAYYAQTIEDALDLGVMRDQQLQEQVGRSVKIPVGADAGFDADELVSSLLNFGDLYLGAKSSAPAVDNQGHPLIIGAVYWDTVSSQMFSWSGSEWKPTFVTGNAVRQLTTATNGQTVISVPTYIVGVNTLTVFLNGLKVMVGADYVETNQNTITFGAGLEAGDEVEVIALQTYLAGTTSAGSVTTEYGVSLARLLELNEGTVAELLADTTLNPAVVPAGSVIEAGGFRYRVVSSGQHLTTAGGVKLYVLSRDVRAFGAVGDGVTNDTAAINAASAAGFKIAPCGDFLITSFAIVADIENWHGNGRFFYNGAALPIGPVTSFLQLNVPSVFATIQAAVDFCEAKTFKDAGFIQIKLADGDYGSVLSPLAGIEPRFPSGSDHIEIIGNTSNKAAVKLFFSAASNGCGFLFHRGNGIFKLNGMTLVGVGGRTAYGVWNSQTYGAGVMVNYNSQVLIGSQFEVTGFYYGIASRYGSGVRCEPGVVVRNAGDCGFFAYAGAMDCQDCQAYDVAHISDGLGFGFTAEAGGFMDCSNSNSSGNYKSGFYANGAGMWAKETVSDNNQGDGFLALNGGRIEVNPPPGGVASNSFDNGGAGYRASGMGSYINGNASLASRNGGGGRIAEYGAAIDLTSSSATSNTGVGNLARFGGGLYGDSATATSNTSHGFHCNVHSWARGSNWSSNSNGGWGYRADDLSYMEIPSSGGISNTAGFDSPALVGTPGNNGSYIEN